MVSRPSVLPPSSAGVRCSSTYSAMRTVRLHDVFLRLPVGLHTNSSSLHSRLIDAWGGPRQLPDAYAWRHLAHHLAGVGRLEELKPLLLDYTWLKAKLNRSDAIALRDDAARFPDDRDFRLLAAPGTVAHPGEGLGGAAWTALWADGNQLARPRGVSRADPGRGRRGGLAPAASAGLDARRQPTRANLSDPGTRLYCIGVDVGVAGGRFRGRPTVRCGCGICRVRRAASWAGTGAGSDRWR